MTWQELRDPCLSAIIARKMANVHCLDVPINKEPTWLLSSMQKYLAAFQGKSPVEHEPISRQLMSVDFQKEINWLQNFLQNVSHDLCDCGWRH